MTEDDRNSSIGDEASQVTYLGLDDMIAFHADLFGLSIDQGRAWLRNPGGLESALNRPRQYVRYADASIALQAAVLAHGIAEGQPFINGNKRTTLVALSAFLEANGYRLVMPDDRLALLVLDLSTGLTVEALSERIAEALVPTTGDRDDPVNPPR